MRQELIRLTESLERKIEQSAEVEMGKVLAYSVQCVVICLVWSIFVVLACQRTNSFNIDILRFTRSSLIFILIYTHTRIHARTHAFTPTLSCKYSLSLSTHIQPHVRTNALTD